MTLSSPAASSWDATWAQAVSGHCRRAAAVSSQQDLQPLEVLVFTLFQTLHISPSHPMASNSIDFHFKATSWSYTISCFFPTMHGFLFPHGAPQAKQNCASPGRKAMRVSSSSASCPCLLQTVFLKCDLNRGQSTGARYMLWHHHVFLFLTSLGICFWPLLPCLQQAQDLSPKWSMYPLQHAE